MTTKASPIRLVAAVMLGGLLVSSPLAAQAAKLADPAGGKGAAAKERFQDMAAQLQLTDQQKQQLKPILREEAQKLKSLWAETGVAKRQKHGQLNQIRQELTARVKAILTPEQFAKWQELRAELRAQRHLKGQSKALGL
jgi:Spy/CpxP family protein refolding chaperone